VALKMNFSHMGKCVKNSFQATAYLRLVEIREKNNFQISKSVTQSVIHEVKKERNIKFFKSKTLYDGGLSFINKNHTLEESEKQANEK